MLNELNIKPENIELEIIGINQKPSKSPKRGIYISGLKLIGGSFDIHSGNIRESKPFESVHELKIVLLHPYNNKKKSSNRNSLMTMNEMQKYKCPIYLFRNNHEDSGVDTFISWVYMNTEVPVETWINRNAHVVCFN